MQVDTRGLHSSTFRLNLSTFSWIRGVASAIQPAQVEINEDYTMPFVDIRCKVAISVEGAWSARLKLFYVEPLSKFAFNFQLAPLQLGGAKQVLPRGRPVQVV